MKLVFSWVSFPVITVTLLPKTSMDRDHVLRRFNWVRLFYAPTTNPSSHCHGRRVFLFPGGLKPKAKMPDSAIGE